MSLDLLEFNVNFRESDVISVTIILKEYHSDVKVLAKFVLQSIY